MFRISLITTLLIAVISSTIALASDSLDRIIENKITSGLTNIGNSIAEIIPGEGDTEVTISEQDNYDIKFSILAVRPIVKNPYQGLNREHLYFTQLRLSSHEPFANGDERTLLNAGIGFRTLVNNNNAILGANLFHDYEFDEGHQRGSFGVEYLSNNFQLYANLYDRLSDKVSYTSGSTTITEEIVNGYDYSIVGSLPYLPWAKVIYTGYSWDKTGVDLEGNRVSLEAHLINGLLFEYGKNDIDNSSDDEDFYKITLKWPQDHLTPTLKTHGITSYAFPTYNMKDEMLHKVRRTNNMITEQSGGGFFVVRGT
jgi:hypothetical protein